MGGRGVPAYSLPDEADLVVQTATTRPAKLGRPFTRWSLRKLADHLARRPGPGLRIGRESLRTLLHRHHIIFQRTTTWKDSPDTPHAIPNSTASNTSWSTFPTGSLPSTSSTPGASAPLPPRTPCPRPRGRTPGPQCPTVPVVATAKKKGITPISGDAEMEEWGGQEEDADHGV